MAKQVSEETKITLDLKTIGIILFFVATVVGMWFTLQGDIQEAKELPLPEIDRIEYDLKDELIRQTIMDTQDDVDAIRDQLDKIDERFILYLQVDDGEIRLDRQHFALYCLDSDAIDDGELLDIGTYTWLNPDDKFAGVEIPGDQEYVVWNEVIVQDAGQLGGQHSGLICLTAEGEFYNPYIQSNMTVSMRLENFPIGLDVDDTPYGYLID